MNDTSSKHIPEAVETFIDRWTDRDGMERANYQLFLTGDCRRNWSGRLTSTA